MNRKIASAITYSDDKAIYSALFLCLLSAFAYVYFVSVSIVEVVVREELIGNVASIATEISKNEETYLALKGSVTEDEAARLGLAELSGKSYVTIVVPTLSINQ